MNVIGFHNPKEPYGFLSNWYLSPFTLYGQDFSSMEQYMMHSKAVLFGDAKHAEEILATDDVAKIKELGKDVQGYNDVIWNGVRQIVIYEGLMAKFTQNWELRQQLLGTGDSILAECARGDLIWGIGLAMDDPGRFDTGCWHGKNLLGFALMKVRDSLRRV